MRINFTHISDCGIRDQEKSEMCCRIDHQMEFGQVRQLNPDVIKERVYELKANPPGAPLRLTVWMEAGVPTVHPMYKN